jgi:hypothetical protein
MPNEERSLRPYFGCCTHSVRGKLEHERETMVKEVLSGLATKVVFLPFD